MAARIVSRREQSYSNLSVSLSVKNPACLRYAGSEEFEQRLDNLKPRQRKAIIHYYGMRGTSRCGSLRALGVIIGHFHNSQRRITGSAAQVVLWKALRNMGDLSP